MSNPDTQEVVPSEVTTPEVETIEPTPKVDLWALREQIERDIQPELDKRRNRWND